ncbi:MAG: exo-alpha-sialidase [Sphingomonadaceae bacterium]|nr:exo-alpha-sialidase [Sphingomonadaceae bacterium]MCP5390579.1 exo-alpha-sialidase [Sphingomonadaceae bacterium]MCP5392774.1 exo-alpha-sialidase [Sphingomonadaceae bacterium]
MRTRSTLFRTAWRWLFRGGLLLAAGLVACIAWFVLGPASRAPVTDKLGVPERAIPRMTAKQVSDLPMQCAQVATGGPKGANGRTPHRNHTYLTRFDGQYFVMFSHWYGAEGQPGQAVQFATSSDGVSWSEPRPLADPASGHGIIARGFVERDGKLYAWYATHTGDTFFRNGKEFRDPAQFTAERNIAILESEWTGPETGWQFNRRVLDGYANNYAPRQFGEAQVMAVRDQDRETYLAISDDNGMSWNVGEAMPVPAKPERGEQGLYLPDEPVTLDYDSGSSHVLLRNNNTADRRMWATEVKDGHWQDPYPLDFPSDASKFLPVELDDGRTALVGNFEPDVHRALLNLAVSDDGGKSYHTLYRLAPENQYSGLGWRSPQYPHAIVDEDRLLVGFAYGKRDIAVCTAPADADGLEKASGFSLLPRLFKGLCNRDLPVYLRRAAGYAGCREHFVWG